MVKFFFLILFSLNVYADSYRNAVDLIKQIRPNLRSKNMSVEVTALDDLINKEQLEIARFGFGRGVIPFWKKMNGEVVEKQLRDQCSINHMSYLDSTVQHSQYTILQSNVTAQVMGDVETSILTPSRALDAFYAMYAYQDKLIPREYGVACESRTHLIAMLLESMCIKSAKVFIEHPSHQGHHLVLENRSFDWAWYYHVAPVVTVMTEKGLIPHVFDHSLFNKPVPVEQWVHEITKLRPEINFEISYTRSYIMYPNQKEAKHKYYKQVDVDEMNKRLRTQKLKSIIRPFIGPL